MVKMFSFFKIFLMRNLVWARILDGNLYNKPHQVNYVWVTF